MKYTYLRFLLLLILTSCGTSKNELTEQIKNSLENELPKKNLDLYGLETQIVNLVLTKKSDYDYQGILSTKEIRKPKYTTGFGFLDPKYLSQIAITWKPEEVDLIIILADSDDKISERQKSLKDALKAIQDNHLDASEKIIKDQSIGGLAIRDFEAWLLADFQTVSTILSIKIPELSNLEESDQTKTILENAIAESSYLSEKNNRQLEIRWHLAHQIDLTILRKSCPQGYGIFSQDLLKLTQIFIQKLL
jgi:hypothetical protein